MNAFTQDFGFVQPKDASRTLLSAFRARLAEFSGIDVKADKESLVGFRLSSRVVATGCKNLNRYLHQVLYESEWREEFMIAVEMMTTNTTYFFREDAHFNFLANTIVPELAQDAGPDRFRIKLWSAASSEGAEAYTAAMVLAEAKAKHSNMDFSIFGTDISEQMIAKARLAIYPKSATRNIADHLRCKYLLKGLEADVSGQVRICPELRSRVRFAQMNLMSKAYPIDSSVDVAMLRNVLIYFSPKDQSSVINRVTSRIKPGGYLIVGCAESMSVNHSDLVQIEPSIYRKR